MSAFEIFYLIGLPLLILAASVIVRTVLNRPVEAASITTPDRPTPALTRGDIGEFVRPRAAKD